MSTISNQIEIYLKELLNRTESGVLELKRSDLAGTFMCVPSQINYVLETRFSPRQGYMVESRRGGGGFVRIIRLSMDQDSDVAALLENNIARRVDRQSGEKLVERLVEEDILTHREAMLINALTGEAALKGCENGDEQRSRMLNCMLQLLLRDDFV